MADIYYYDISKKGKDLLGNKDIVMLTNDQAVIDSIYNILGTEVGTKIMDVEYGAYLERYLFEPIDEFTSEMIKYDINLALEKFEERIKDINITVTPYEDENTYDIVIEFTIVYSNSQQKIDFKFNKIR